MSNAIIDCQNLKKSFFCNGNHINVINNINLTVNKNDYIALVGPSGSGKSTLLHMMGLLLDPDSGRINIQNEDIRFLSEKKKARIRNKLIGFIFQSYHLLPELSAIENIILPALLSGLSQKEATSKASLLLEKVNLSLRKNHHPNELSGGEQQRICICRALINDPLILLADEPTGNLDSHNAENVILLLENLIQDCKTTLVLVTHNNKIAKRADKIVAINDGLIN